MEKRNILFMGIHSELTLFVLISEWQDFESVLTWPFSAGLLLPQCSCHINSSSPNLESVVGSGISSFVFFSGTRLLISPCSHLRKCTDSCQDESWLFLRHTWRTNLWLIDRSFGHRLSHQEPPLSRQVQAWGITSDSQQESTHWQNSCVNLLLWFEDTWLFLTPLHFLHKAVLAYLLPQCLSACSCMFSESKGCGMNGSLEGDLVSRLIPGVIELYLPPPHPLLSLTLPLLCTDVIGLKRWRTWKQWREMSWKEEQWGFLDDRYWLSA